MIFFILEDFKSVCFQSNAPNVDYSLRIKGAHNRVEYDIDRNWRVEEIFQFKESRDTILVLK